MSSDIYSRSHGNQNWRKLHFTAIEEKIAHSRQFNERSAVIDMLGNSISPISKRQYK